jgi:hypothetical protein
LSQTRYRLWAAIASVLFHAAVLSALAASRLYPASGVSASTERDGASAAMVRTIVQGCPLVAKPDVRYVTAGRLARLSLLPDKSGVPASAVHPTSAEPAVQLSSEYADLAWSQDNSVIPAAQFFSSRTRCRRICYLVDCSGSMTGLIAQVKSELARSIGALRQDQYFGIVFFGDDKVWRFSSGSLVRASDAAKRQAAAFIKSADAAGRTNALAGFLAALKTRDDDEAGPQAIYFLTDGFELSTDDAYQFRQDVLELLKSYQGGCVVNTIGLWPSDSDRLLLESISQLSGGSFVCVAQQDLPKGGR